MNGTDPRNQPEKETGSSRIPINQPEEEHGSVAEESSPDDVGNEKTNSFDQTSPKESVEPRDWPPLDELTDCEELRDYARFLEQRAQADMDLLQRLKAEFDNFRKRSRQERSDWIDYANRDLIRNFLPVLDDLDRALDAVDEGNEKSLIEGVRIIRATFLRILEQYQVTRIDTLDKPFNPEWHEAVSILQDDGKQDGTVLHEIAPGYRMGNNLLRVSKVIVNRLPEEDDAADNSA